MDKLGRKAVVASLILLVLLPASVALAKSSVKKTSLKLERSPRGDVVSGTAVSFSGKLQSSKHACRSGQTVELVKIGTGVVATATTDSHGHYAFAAQVVTTDSVFQSHFGGSIVGTHPHTRTCAGSVSKALEVEVRGSTGVLGTGGAAAGAGGLALGSVTAFTGRNFVGAIQLLAILLIAGLAALTVGRRRSGVSRGI